MSEVPHISPDVKKIRKFLKIKQNWVIFSSGLIILGKWGGFFRDQITQI
jgi:hypothetical protein